jgi:hypothetical protein
MNVVHGAAVLLLLNAAIRASAQEETMTSRASLGQYPGQDDAGVNG